MASRFWSRWGHSNPAKMPSRAFLNMSLYCRFQRSVPSQYNGAIPETWVADGRFESKVAPVILGSVCWIILSCATSVGIIRNYRSRVEIPFLMDFGQRSLRAAVWRGTKPIAARAQCGERPCGGQKSVIASMSLAQRQHQVLRSLVL